MEKAKMEMAGTIYSALNTLNHTISWESNRLRKENADEMTPDQLKKAYERCRKVMFALRPHVSVLYEQTGWKQSVQRRGPQW